MIEISSFFRYNQPNILMGGKFNEDPGIGTLWEV